MGFFADSVDNIGTFFNLRETGLSERLSGGRKTPNTGRVAYTGNGTAVDDDNYLYYQSAMYDKNGMPTGKPTENTPYVEEYTPRYPGITNTTAQTAAEKAAAIDMIDQEIAAIDKALGNSNATWDAGRRQVGDAYDKGLNRLNEQQSNALSKYATTGNYNYEIYTRHYPDVIMNLMNEEDAPYVGMSLSVKSTQDDFETNLYTISTYAEFSGNENMRENDIVDMLNYLATSATLSCHDTSQYPHLRSIDPLGHTFLNPYLASREVEQLAEFAKRNKDKDIEWKLLHILSYCKNAEKDGDTHRILQFDGM